jgi:hypothetical protein
MDWKRACGRCATPKPASQTESLTPGAGVWERASARQFAAAPRYAVQLAIEAGPRGGWAAVEPFLAETLNAGRNPGSTRCGAAGAHGHRHAAR